MFLLFAATGRASENVIQSNSLHMTHDGGGYPEEYSAVENRVVSLNDKPNPKSYTDGEKPNGVDETAIVVVVFKVVLDLSVGHGVAAEAQAGGRGRKQDSGDAASAWFRKQPPGTMSAKSVIPNAECRTSGTRYCALFGSGGWDRDYALTAPRRHLSPYWPGSASSPALTVSLQPPSLFLSATQHVQQRTSLVLP